jgi:hypothetical protein
LKYIFDSYRVYETFESLQNAKAFVKGIFKLEILNTHKNCIHLVKNHF